MKPIADESSKSSEIEYVLKNLNQICEEPNNEDDPEYDVSYIQLRFRKPSSRFWILMQKFDLNNMK